MKTRFLLFLFPLLISGFSGNNIDVKNAGVNYGGTFRINLSEDFLSLYPPSIIDASSRHIAGQIYEGLTKYDPRTLQLIPSLAKSWSANSDNTSFTFDLRTDVFFQDDNCFPNGKGRKMTAADVKFCFGELLKQTPQNYSYNSTFSPIVNDTSAFVVINDSTFLINTSKPCYYLTGILAQPACWIYPHEALEKYGNDMRSKCVGTGPFGIKTLTEGDVCLLQKNTAYWRKDSLGNKLPYFDNVKFTFIKDKRSEMIAFRNNELDMEVDPDADILMSSINDNITDFADQRPLFMLDHMQTYSLFYIGFRDDVKPFNNYKVRQAFNLAIDKGRIVSEVLKGGGKAVNNGFLPDNIPGYTSIAASYSVDVDRAKQLLKEAGYPNGKGFPKIELETTSSGASSTSVAEMVMIMLKQALNVNIQVTTVPFAQWLDDVESGKAMMWRSAWIADNPDPREFLQLAYGKNVPKDVTQPSIINPMRFVDASFDATYESALNAADNQQRMSAFAKAESIAMDKAFILPLYYPDCYVLFYSNVKGYSINSLDICDLSAMYFAK